MLDFEKNENSLVLGGSFPMMKPKAGQTAPISETKATLTKQTAITFIAKAKGTAGLVVTIGAKAAPDDTLALTITDNDLTVNLANTTPTKNKMSDIAALILATPEALALVYPAVLVGATQMTAFTSTALSGGLNGTPGAFCQTLQDTNGVKWSQISPYPGYYYWSPDGMPANNIAYVSHYDKVVGAIVYKIRMEGTSADATSTAFAHGVLNWGNIYVEKSGMAIYFAGGSQWYLPGYPSSGLTSAMAAGTNNITIFHGASLRLSSYKLVTYFSKLF